MHYSPIPDGTSYLKLHKYWCGDIYCDCHKINIIAYGICRQNLPSIKYGEQYPIYTVWESPVWCGHNLKEIRKAAEEVIWACEYYDIEYNKNSMMSNSILVWEFKDKWME